MGTKAGAVGEAEVILQDGGNQTRKAVEGVLAIAVGVIEADAFRRVAEALGFLQSVKVDDEPKEN